MQFVLFFLLITSHYLVLGHGLGQGPVPSPGPVPVLRAGWRVHNIVLQAHEHDCFVMISCPTVEKYSARVGRSLISQ